MQTSTMALLALVTACSTGTVNGASFDSAEPEPTEESPADVGADFPGTADQGSVLDPAQGGNDPPQEPPPEVEVEATFRAPVVTGQLIWSANPQSGQIALVDALTHEVQTLPAGLQPTYLTAVGGQGPNRALVINRGSSDATLFRDGADGALELLDIPVHQLANAWAISPTGRYAVAWSDERELGELDATEGLQDITLIDLNADPPVASRFSVGYRPVQITIDAEESRMYAVTRDGISVLSLGDAPALAEDIQIDATGGFDTASAPVLADVPITDDGAFAVLRFAGAPRVDVVSLRDDQSVSLTLPGEVTDVDLVPGTDQAVAVIRETSQVARFSLREAFADPSAVSLSDFADEVLGSVALSEAGARALLYTNATASDRLTLLDLSESSFRTVSLKAPVSAVFPSPEGSHAIALLETAADSERAGAFSVVPVSSALPAKIQGTDAPPFRVAVADTSVGLRGLIATRWDERGIFAVYLVRMPSLQVDRLELSTAPSAVGLLPEHGLGYVAQEHPEGRITFIDLETAQAQTLTGFELADRVIDGAGR